MDASKLRSELGWTPTRTFADGLRDTVQWYAEHHGTGAFNANQVGYNRQRLGLGLVTA